jgi:hypothetical protein
MEEQTKVCTKCLVEKPIEDFYKRTDGSPRCFCKMCWKIYSLPYVKKYGKTKRGKDANKRYHQTERGKDVVNKNKKKIYHCAKVFCKKLPPQKIVECVCKRCGATYGIPKSRYDARMKGDPKYYPKYCSRECQWISMTKKWQQTDSLYAKKIKELKQEYK